MISHGTVIAKRGTILNITEDAKGVITTYLPDMDGGTFAVKFINGPWYTFKEPEAAFVKRFKEVKLTN